MKKFLSILMIVTVGIFLVAGSASALSMRLTQGSNIATITDSDLDGFISFMGPVGVFNINLSGGLSKPAIGNPPFSIDMDLSSLNSSTGAGTLLVELSDTGFTLNDQNGAFYFTSSIGGVTSGTIDFNTYIDYNNNLFNQANLVTNQAFGPGAFGASVTGSVASDPNLFSLTQAVQITHTGLGVSSFNATVSVPDVGIMWLLGTAFVMLGFLGRKKSCEQL